MEKRKIKIILELSLHAESGVLGSVSSPTVCVSSEQRFSEGPLGPAPASPGGSGLTPVLLSQNRGLSLGCLWVGPPWGGQGANAHLSVRTAAGECRLRASGRGWERTSPTRRSASYPAALLSDTDA